MRDGFAEVQLLEPRFALSTNNESSVVDTTKETSATLHDTLEMSDPHATAEIQGGQILVHLPHGEHQWCLYEMDAGKPREEKKGQDPVQGNFFCEIPEHPGQYQLVFSAGQRSISVSFNVTENGTAHITSITGPNEDGLPAIPRALPLPARTDSPGIITYSVQAHDDVAYPASTQKSSEENPPSTSEGNVRPVKPGTEDFFAPLNRSPLEIKLDDLGADNPRKTKLPLLMVFDLELELKARLDRVFREGDFIGAAEGLPAEIYGRTLRELQEERLKFGLGYGPDEIRENYHKAVEEILRRALIQAIWKKQNQTDKRDTRPLGPPPTIGMNDSDKVFADSNTLFASLDGEKAEDPALVAATASLSVAHMASLFASHPPSKRKRAA